MTSAVEALDPEVTEEAPPAKYHVEQPVIFRSLFNIPGHEGDKVRGKVISLFLNGSRSWTYRIQLDIVYNEKVPLLAGQPIIVGNITEGFISLP